MNLLGNDKDTTPRTATPGAGGKAGAVLFATVTFLVTVSLLGATLYTFTQTDVQMAGQHKRSAEAFYHADAGIQYVVAQIRKDVDDGALELDDDVESVYYAAPAGLDFDPVTTLNRLPDGESYAFEVTGRAPGGAQTTIEAVIQPGAGGGLYGIFSDTTLEIKNQADVFSYNSDFTLNPTPTDSTAAASIAANDKLMLKNGAFIDGSTHVGEDSSGNPGKYENEGADVTGEEGVKDGYIDYDPLGVVGGPLADRFIEVAANNDNALAIPPILGNEINLEEGETVILNSGQYYLDELNLEEGGELHIVPSTGPVEIFITGKLEAKEESAINHGGRPTDFYIYSNSSDDIEFKIDSEFRGMFYAPLASIEFKIGSPGYGMLWGQKVELKDDFLFYVDEALVNSGGGGGAWSLAMWKHIRD